ncbi:hypothetical protein ACFGVR_10435 [Mucilaginibacter sp. AW1-3]
MSRPFILLLCICFVACTGNGRGPLVKPSKSITDSVDKAFAPVDTVRNQTGPSPAQILKDCLSNYKTVTTVDTTLLTDSGALHIHVRHYCAYDAGIMLPEKYSKLIGLKAFATNNFITDILLSRNLKPIYAGRVTRDDFLPLLGDELKNYGSLLFIDRRIQRSRSGRGFVINYSIGIPLTDVGQQVTMAIEADGTKQAFVNYGFKAEKAYPDTANAGAKKKEIAKR